MIGWWNVDVVANAPRRLLGPCGPLPHCTRQCSWPSTLACTPEEVIRCQQEAYDPKPHDVQEVWHDYVFLLGVGGGGATASMQ